VLAQHQPGAFPAYVFGIHDLVGSAVLQHAVLMDAGFVRKGVVAHDRLVDLHLQAGDAGETAADGDDAVGTDVRVRAAELLASGRQRHDDFFQRGVASAFANAVDGYLCLTGASRNRCQCVGGAHAQIVVTMDRDDHIVDSRHALLQVGHQIGVFGRRGVADRIGHVQRRRSRLDSGIEHLHQEVPIGAGRILGGKLDIAGE